MSGLKERVVHPLEFMKIALIVLAPTLIGAVFATAPRWCAAIGRLWPEPDPGPQPVGRPIEQLAADLRRLLRLHEELTASAHLALRAHRLWAVEAAIGARAVEAARALEVPHREPAPTEMLTRSELALLLRALTEAGLVLPTSVGTFTRDGRL
jgi:hypothetical protein